MFLRSKEQKYFLRSKDIKKFLQGAQRIQDAARGRAATSGGKTARAAGEEGASA